MQIRPELKAGLVELPHRRAAIWRRFSVRATGVQLVPSFDPNAEGDFEIELEVEVGLDGEAVCKSARISGPEVRGDDMRIPIATLVRDAKARAVFARFTDVEGYYEGMNADERDEVVAALQRSRRQRRKRTRNTPEHRQRVAELYRQARAEGVRPVDWIALEMTTAESAPTAYAVNKWIGWAREGGELERGRPGRPRKPRSFGQNRRSSA